MIFLKNKYGVIIVVSLFFISCSSIQRSFKNKEKEHSHFKGFVLYDPVAKKELINHNGAKYFTPASNTKLFTFYTAYKALDDSLKSFEYTQVNDSLILRGTADPTLLYGFDSTKVVNFLTKDASKIYIVDATINEPKLGTGWSWDDYQYYYMPEKSLFPVYGNVVKYKVERGNLYAEPSILKNKIKVVDTIVNHRDYNTNQFYAKKSRKRNRTVPFKTSTQTVAEILQDFLQKEVSVIKDKSAYNFQPFYNTKKDSVLKEMLVVSDNFIAEQLLLQVSKKVTNAYSVDSAVAYSLKNYLKEIPQTPRWVDGSGLSRYNLFTPKNMVFLLDKMYQEIPREQLFSYFPVGGKSGTLKKWYKGKKPYVYAKSGTLSNNYNLSGYLVTKKGKVLIFSSMNNHFKIPLSEVKTDLEQTLFKIYNTY